MRPVNWECCGRAGTLNVGSAIDWLLSNVAAAADLGRTGTLMGESFAGIEGFSVWGPGSTGGSEVSIFRLFGFCPESLRLRTEAASLVAVVGRGVSSAASPMCIVCASGTGGNAPEGAGTGGGEWAVANFEVLGCSTYATVDSYVQPVVLCEDTELLYVLPEKPLESDCRGSEDLVCRSKSKPSNMYSVISSNIRSSSSASSLKTSSALSRTCGKASFRNCVSL